jgi:arylsulfatase A-like enzyme
MRSSGEEFIRMSAARIMKVAGWILLLLLCRFSVAVAAEKPNIVLIFADDLGWKDIGWNNEDGFIETPNLDRLKAQSMTFTAAYASAGNCAPSRACLLSGKYTPRHGVYAVGDTDRGPKDKFRLVPVPNSQQLKPSFVTMAEALKAQGYVTGHFGKWHLGSAAQGSGPLQQGFDVGPPELIPSGDERGGGPEESFLDHPRRGWIHRDEQDAPILRFRLPSRGSHAAGRAAGDAREISAEGEDGEGTAREAPLRRVHRGDG